MARDAATNRLTRPPPLKSLLFDFPVRGDNYEGRLSDNYDGW
jgi:hypothetical protein